MYRKRIMALLLAAVMLVTATACNSDSSQDDGSGGPAPIKVGVLYPLSGGTATAGNSALWAAQWITDYVNNELGGIQSLGGAKIQLVVGDTKGDSETALSEFERMVGVENVSVLFGLYNTAVANTLSQYCIANRVPVQVTNAVGNDAFMTENSYVFHANASNATNSAYGKPRMEWLREYSGDDLLRYAFVYDAADYGRESYETALATMSDNGTEEIFGIAIEAGSADFSSEILKLKNNPAIEYINPIMSMNDAILFVRQMKEYEVALPMFSSGGGFLQADFLEQAGDAADYIFSTAMWFPSQWKSAWDTEFAKDVVDQYYAEMGWEFDESASLAWLGMWSLWDALERAGSRDREDIAAAMAATDISGEHYATLLSGSKTVRYESKVEPTTGIMLYNQNFDTPLPWAVVQDGEYHVVWPEELAEPGFVLPWPVPAWSDR